MRNRLHFAWTLVAAAALIAGCGEARKRDPIDDDFFFPQAPVPARIQFVRGFTGSADLQDRAPLVEYLAGQEASEVYSLVKPFSVASWKGRIYVTDSFGAMGLNVIDLENHRFYILGKGRTRGALRKPIHVFVDGEGNKYISDLGQRKVVVYDADDAYVRTYGDGKSFMPVSCVVWGDEVFILDIKKDRVRWQQGEEIVEKDVRRDQILVLDKKSGRPLRRIGQHAPGTDGFRFASHMTCDRLGNLYISDFLNHRVLKLDRNGQVLLSLGTHGDTVGSFAKIKGVAVDRMGLIYVVDAEFHVVQVFDNAGKVLFFFGGPAAPRGATALPAGICIDYENVKYFEDYIGPDFEAEYLVIVANQMSAENRVAVYAFGKRTSQEYPEDAELSTLVNQRLKVLWPLPVFPPDVHRARPADRAGERR